MKNAAVRFVTLFPECPNFGVAKDVGQIPYMLEKQNDNISAKLVSFAIDPNGDYLDQAPGLTIEECPNIRNNVLLSGLAYLIRNARKIDWLNIYHARMRTCIWIAIYKLLNPKGRVYVKMDAGFVSCNAYDADPKKRKIFTRITEMADLVTVESMAALEHLSKYAKCDLKLIPNGYCEAQPVDVTIPRQNTFITVSRLGTPEKATGVLLEAFAKTASQHDWGLELVGPVAPAFIPEKERFYQEHPELLERVRFTGEIHNRDVLNDHYNRAKVFVLPSRWESFALVVPEAMRCGCKVIVSDQVTPHREFTADGRFGQAVPVDDVDAWAQALLNATREEYTPELAQRIAAYADEKYTWKNICAQLKEFLD